MPRGRLQKDVVRVDANHPLAGSISTFIKVEGVRDATPRNPTGAREQEAAHAAENERKKTSTRGTTTTTMTTRSKKSSRETSRTRR